MGNSAIMKGVRSMDAKALQLFNKIYKKLVDKTFDELDINNFYSNP